MKLKYSPFLSSLFLVITSLFLGSCGGSETPAETPAADTLVNADNRTGGEEYFQISLPGELFGNLSDYGVKGKAGLLNAPENVTKYNSSKEKALNFGIYSSDLFYCSTFNQKADVLKYFDNLKRLADELGISSVITEQTTKRIEKNLGNKDSLNTITNEVFMEASGKLERNDQGATLALVVAGGLTETIYLSTRLVPFSDSPVMQYIADQKLPFDNLFNYLSKYGTDTRVMEVKTALEPLKSVFDAIKEEPSKSSPQKGKVPVIGAKTRLVMTADDYKKLAETSASIRNSLISVSTAK